MLLIFDTCKLAGTTNKQVHSEVEPDDNAADVVIAAACICLICQLFSSSLGILHSTIPYVNILLKATHLIQ